MNKDAKKKILADLRTKLKEKGATKKELKELHTKFDQVLVALKENLTTQIITKVVPNVSVTNLKQLVDAILEEKTVSVKKPDWYVAPEKTVEVDNIVRVQNVEKEESVIPFLTEAFGMLTKFFADLSNKVFKTKMSDEDFLKPQTFALYDPFKKRYIDLERLMDALGKGGGGANMPIFIGGSGSSFVTIKGASDFQGGTVTVTTAGTRVRLPDVANVRSVTIQAHQANGDLAGGGAIVIGGSDVIAEADNRNGYAIYPMQSFTFEVNNPNKLYIDSTDNGAKITYTYNV